MRWDVTPETPEEQIRQGRERIIQKLDLVLESIVSINHLASRTRRCPGCGVLLWTEQDYETTAKSGCPIQAKQHRFRPIIPRVKTRRNGVGVSFDPPSTANASCFR